MVGLLQALPGTRLHARLKTLNRLEADFTGNNVAGATNIVPVMDRGLLREGYFRVLRTLYSPNGYYRRMRTFLRTYKAPEVRERLSVRYIAAFLRSSIVLGLLHRERFQYWYTLLWTLLRRPRHFPLTVHLAILGYHYRRICRSFC